MYTDKISYITPPTFSGNCVSSLNLFSRFKLDKESPIYLRALETFNSKYFMYPVPPICLGYLDLELPKEEVFVLRMCIKTPTSSWKVPIELEWTVPFLVNILSYQQSCFPDFDQRFYYLTVRVGENRTSQEDIFHVDGFQNGLLEPLHAPQQFYIWSDRDPTLFALQPYFTQGLDPIKHNFHMYFDKHTQAASLYQGLPKNIYCLDPYIVHAKPKGLTGFRATVRLSCIMTDVKDNTNTVNPALPMRPYNKPDPRNVLWEYPSINEELKFGLIKI